MPFYVPNKKVACSPLGKYRSVQMTGNTFKTAAQKGALLKLSVIYGNESYKEDDIVFIKGECMTLPWAKEEFVVAGEDHFILVPEDRIELHIKNEMSDEAFERWAIEKAKAEKENV